MAIDTSKLQTAITDLSNKSDSAVQPIADILSSSQLNQQPSFDLSATDTPITTPQADRFQQDNKTNAEIAQKQASDFAEMARQQEQEAAKASASTATSFDDYVQGILSSPTFSELQAQEYRRQGVDEKQLQVDKLSTQMLAEQDALRTKTERILSEGGGLKSGAQAEISNLERESYAKQADIALLQLAAQDQLDYATRVADRAVNAMFEREERIQSVRKEIYERNKELFDKSEQRAFELRLRDTEMRIQIEREEEKLKRNTQIELVKMLKINGADDVTVQSVLTADSPEEAISIAGASGLIDIEERELQRQLQRQQISNAVMAGRKASYELVQLQAAEERRQAAVEAGELLPEQYEEVDSIDKEFRSDPIVKEFNDAATKRFAFEQIVTGGEQLGVQDLFLVYEFMKSVDPTSVVRESEFDNAAKTGNIFEKQYAKYNGYFTEGQVLPPEVRSAFIGSANAAWSGKQQQYFNVKDQFGEKVNRRFDVENGSNYLTSYEDAAPLDRASSIETAQTGQVIVKNGIQYLKQSDGTYKQLND